MPAEGSITRWIAQLKNGDADAVQPLWETYFARMVELARRRLQDAPRRAADEEDVALSAFHSFYTRARAGLFPRLSDRANLWPLLVAITANKCVDLVRHANRKKRGRAEQTPVDFETLLSQEPTPDFAVQIADQLEHLLARLDQTGDLDLRRIALEKLEGASSKEIAEHLDCVPLTVTRKLRLIAQIWEREGGE